MNKGKKYEIDRIDDIKLIGEAVLIGLFVGLVISFYRFILHFIESILPKIRNILIDKTSYLPFFVILMLLIAILVGYIRNKEKYSGGSGIPQVEAEIKGYINQNPIKIVAAKISSGVACSIGGLSLGREGPSIQIGAMCGKFVSKILKRNRTTEKFLLTSGASAGLAAAFNAPVAGVMFALEEIHRHISKKLLVTCLTSTIIADYVSKLIFGKETTFALNTLDLHIPLNKYWWIILLAVILSVFGFLYTNIMKLINNVYDYLNIPIQVRPIIPFSISILLFFILPQVLGGGSYLLDEIMKNDTAISLLLIMFIVKMLFSLCSFTSGVAGGIFFPILVMGATIGAIFGRIFAPAYVELFIILSMAGFLTAIVRAPMTAIILIFEMTGSLSYLLPLSVICLITYSVTNYIQLVPIYEYLLENLIKKDKMYVPKNNDKEVSNFVVQPGSYLDGKVISNVSWPNNSLIIEIDRGVEKITPKGNTRIYTGDVLSIIIQSDTFSDDYEIISRYCITEKEVIRKC